MKSSQLIDADGAPLWESVISFIKPFAKQTLFASPVNEHSLAFMTGKELMDNTQRLGSVLHNSLTAQQKVIVLLPQGLDYIDSLLACWYANLVVVPVPLSDLTQKEKLLETLDRITSDSKACCIITNTEISEQLNGASCLRSIRLLDINQLRKSKHRIKKERPKQPDELAIVLYSSGSNSQPKGIQVSYQSLVSQMYTGAQQWEISGDSRIISWMPHFHNFGLNFGILAPLATGAFSVIFDAKYFLQKPNLWFDCILQHEATHTAAPNFALDFCVNKVDVEAYQSLKQTPLASLKAIICGGEPISLRSYEDFNLRFESLGLVKTAITCHYGLSEAGSVVTDTINSTARFMSLDIRSLEQNKVKSATKTDKTKIVPSCGKVTDKTSVVIVESGSLTPCAKGAIGEILVHSPSVASGYLNKPDESLATFGTKVTGKDPSFLRTGDLGFIEDEHLYVVGREKDLIIINGKNHHPIDIEASIKCHVAHLNLAGIVFAQEIKGHEKVIVVQEVASGLSQDDYQSIVADIKHAITLNHSIKAHDILLVAENTIPRTGSGKVQKQACRQQHKANKLNTLYRDTEQQKATKNCAPHATSPNNDGLAVIIEILKNKVFAPQLNLTPADLSSVDDFSTIMLDSIQYVIISKKIEEVLEFKFAPVMLFKYPSFTKLASYLQKELTSLGCLPGSKMEVNTSTPSQEAHTTNNEPDDDAIAIIGMSGHFPGGATDLDLFWDNLVNQTNCISTIPSDRQAFLNEHKAGSSDHFPSWGGFLHDVDAFDAEFFGISPLEANSMDPQQRKVMEMTWSVFESAGHNPKKLAGQEVGLFIGAHNNDYLELTLAQPELSEKYGAYLDSGVHMSMLTNRASRWFDFNGPSEVINTACSSSLVAVHHAVESIRKGECSVAVAGGINLILTPRIYKAAHSAGMLSEDGSCKTFDNKANGFVRAEGYGAVLLKPYKQAQKDHDSIYGVIKSAVINHDGKSNSLRAPNLDSQKKLIQSAYHSAGLTPESVSYIEAHGTGTPLGDPIEVEALKGAFSALSNTLPAQYCGLGTAKTNIGHCESAAGIAGLIKVLLSMKYQMLPSMLHFNQLNSAISLEQSPFYLVDKNQPWQRLTDADGEVMPFRAGVSSFGFGGVNAHVVLEEYMADRNERYEQINDAQLIILSAKTDKQLQKVASRLHQHMMRHCHDNSLATMQTLADIAYTLQVGRHDMQERLAIIADTATELMGKLRQFISGDKNDRNVYRGSVDKAFELLNWESDEGLATAFNYWFEEKALHKIASFWVRGATPASWQGLHQHTSPKRISLPTYPFAQNRYWLPDLPQKETVQPNNAMNLFGVNSALNGNDIAASIVKVVSDNTELLVQNIDKSVNLSALGIDSILRLKLANQIVKMYPECDIDHGELLLLQNINEIVQLVQGKSGDFSTHPDEEHTATSNEKAATDTDLSLKVKEMISHHTGHAVDNLDSARELGELGLDSITRLKLTNDIVKTFSSLALEQSQILPLSTINEITALLRNGVNPAQPVLSTTLGSNEEPVKGSVESSGKNAQALSDQEDEVPCAQIEALTQTLKSQKRNILIKNVKPSEFDPDALQAQMIVHKDHPFFNDHPLDHITGVQLIESMMQLIKVSELRNDNTSSYYTSALSIDFSAFCESKTADLFCTEVSCDEQAQTKSLITRVTQQGKNICQANVTIERMPPTVVATKSSMAIPDDVTLCVRSSVNKHQNENVFISGPSSVWDQPGVWFMHRHSDTIFTDNTEGFIDITHLIEGCRQHERSMTKLSLAQETIEGGAKAQSEASQNGVGILKSLEIRLLRALQQDESVFITNGDMNVLDVGGNRVINWQSDLLVDGEVVGIYKMEAMVLSNDVYDTWRATENEQVMS